MIRFFKILGGCIIRHVSIIYYSEISWWDKKPNFLVEFCPKLSYKLLPWSRRVETLGTDVVTENITYRLDECGTLEIKRRLRSFLRPSRIRFVHMQHLYLK